MSSNQRLTYTKGDLCLLHADASSIHYNSITFCPLNKNRVFLKAGSLFTVLNGSNYFHRFHDITHGEDHAVFVASLEGGPAFRLPEKLLVFFSKNG